MQDVVPRTMRAIVNDLRLFIILFISFLNSNPGKDFEKNKLLHPNPKKCIMYYW